MKRIIGRLCYLSDSKAETIYTHMTSTPTLRSTVQLEIIKDDKRYGVCITLRLLIWYTIMRMEEKEVQFLPYLKHWGLLYV